MFANLKGKLLAAAEDLAHELNAALPPRKKLCIFDRLVLAGLPFHNSHSAASSDLHPDRALMPFTDPEDLRIHLLQAFSVDSLFFVWNLSGVSWDANFCECVEYNFPNRPIPPLSALMEIVHAIFKFLSASPNHVAVVHDLSGRRSAVVVACVLHLMKQPGALAKVCFDMGTVGQALVATQERYFSYFTQCTSSSSSSLVEGKVPVFALKRIIVNGGVPLYGTSLVPQFRVFDATGKEYGKSKSIASVTQADEGFCLVPFQSKIILSGDCLIRFYTKELAMFAVGFHTQFLEFDEESGGGVLRLGVNELDGTKNNPRFPPGMFLDVVFVHEESEEEASLWRQIEDSLDANALDEADGELSMDFTIDSFLEEDDKLNH